MTNEGLIQKLKDLVREERRITMEVLRHLREVERRRLFLERGFSSLFAFCTDELGYSQSAAHRRISAMRLIRDLPAAASAVESGKLSLSNATTLQGFFRTEKLQPEEKLAMVHQAQNQSRQGVEKLIRAVAPHAIPREKLRTLTPEETEVRVVLPAGVLKKLERVKALASHRNPNPSYAELIEFMADLALKKLDPEVKVVSKRLTSASCSGAAHRADGVSAPASTSATEVKVHRTPSRYIPAAIRTAVWKRDQGKCTFNDPITGRKCDSRHFVQLDHVHPYAKGGVNTEQNLRLLCGGHNRARRKQTANVNG